MALSSADFFREAFDYGYWARDRLLARVPFIPWNFFSNSAELDHGTMQKTLIHVLEAEMTWRARITGERDPASLTETKLPDLESLTQAWATEEAKMRAFLADLTDEHLDRNVEFSMRNGTPRSIPSWQILYQSTNHATHHRAEVAFGLTRYGHSPGDLDYFVYVASRA